MLVSGLACVDMWTCAGTSYLVGLDGSNLLILLNVVADLLAPLFQGALGNGLGHLRNLYNGLGICTHLRHENGQGKVAS